MKKPQILMMIAVVMISVRKKHSMFLYHKNGPTSHTSGLESALRPCGIAFKASRLGQTLSISTSENLNILQRVLTFPTFPKSETY